MNFLRYYNQNRKSIWLVIIAIIILIIAIQVINFIVKNNIENTRNNRNEIIDKNDYRNNLDISVLITDEEVQEEKELIVDQFIRYCNSGKVQDAYNLLTDDCKEKIFPTIEQFEKNYININFSNTKLYSKQVFNGNTYKIKLYENILSTGNISSNYIEDYFTIKRIGIETKLNICGYIESKELNKKIENGEYKVEIKEVQVYKDYIEYKIEFNNLTTKTILIDSKEKTRTTYLVGKNDTNYYALAYENLTENLLVKPQEIKTIIIKFDKEYTTNNEINKLVFSDVIIDYDKYKDINKKSEYKDRMKIEIAL